MNLEIIHDDEDIVVVNKPVGMIVYPALDFEGESLTETLKDMGIKISTSGDEERQGVISRLDVTTSGIMVLAKNEDSFQSLKTQFSEHTVTKTYYAIVDGKPKLPQAYIESPIKRISGHKYIKFEINKEGREAKTLYTELCSSNVLLDTKTGPENKIISLLEVQPKTGRTHQIRVHLSAIGHPIIGDRIYGANSRISEKLSVERPLLHSHKLSFVHPGLNETVEYTLDEFPDDLNYVIEQTDLQF
ncbi:MAG: RluA family pseudouridine synthase [Bifidobacteriaceae bacterium]|jgi:23S rRNA pseudouridine1911/1915/1917 synthase|nr:RluA family pseudouridine synthase [Bifidobacteriaceae bacterium]